MIKTQSEYTLVSRTLLAPIFLTCLLFITACTSPATNEPTAVELETAVLEQTSASTIEQANYYKERYGVTKEIVSVQTNGDNLEIQMRVYSDGRWNMNADRMAIPPPNNMLMHSLDYPALVSPNGTRIYRSSTQGTPLRMDESGQHYTETTITFTDLTPQLEQTYRLETNIEFNEIRAEEPFVLNLTGRDLENGEEWEIDQTARIGGITYHFNRAKLTNTTLALFSSGIIESGFRTISFYTNLAIDTPLPESYANGASGIFDDPNIPLAIFSLTNLDQDLGDHIELYFRASVEVVEPYTTEFNLSDYEK